MNQETKKKIIAVTIFAIAMGYLEATVVVYLRELYYQSGFYFPLIPSRAMSGSIYLIELGRELTTLVMLGCLGAIAGRNFPERFAYFILGFGVWDIFFYGALKLTINWPQSFLEYDILFLIPLPWVAPVLAPMIVAATMIFAAVVIIRLSDRHAVRFKRSQVLLTLGATLLAFLSFVYLSPDVMAGDIPSGYPWWLLGMAEVIWLSVILSVSSAA